MNWLHASYSLADRPRPTGGKRPADNAAGPPRRGAAPAGLQFRPTPSPHQGDSPPPRPRATDPRRTCGTPPRPSDDGPMPILRQTAQLGHPVLRMPALPVEWPASAEVRSLVEDMLATLHEADGVGIAAPQVHQSRSIFIVASRPNPRYPD